MTPEQAVAALDAITVPDPDADHGRADDILLQVVPAEVAEAYFRLQGRCDWWATA